MVASESLAGPNAIRMSRISLAKHSAWIFTAKLIGFAISFVLPLIMVRQLRQTEYGVYRQTFSVLNTAVTILPFGLGMSAFYFLSREPWKRSAAIFNILLFYFFAGAVACFTLVFFPSLLEAIFHDLEMGRLSSLVGLLILVSIFAFFLEIVAVANKEPKVAMVFIVFSQVGKAVFLISSVLIFGTVTSVIIAATIQAFLQSVVLALYLVRRFPRFWTSFDRGFVREHFAYALPLGFAALLWAAQTDLHLYFVGAWFDSHEFAIYAVGCFQLPVLSMLLESAGSVLIPRMSQLQLEGNTHEMLHLTARAAEKLALVYFPGYIFAFVMANPLIELLFTAEYSSSATIFRIFLTTIPFAVIMVDPIIRAYPKMGSQLLYFRILTIPILMGGLLFVVRYNDLRLVIATVVTFMAFEKIVLVVAALVKLGMTGEDLHLFKRLTKCAVASVVAGGVAFLAYVLLAPVASSALQSMEGTSPFWNPRVIESLNGVLVLGGVFVPFASFYIFAILRFRILSEEDQTRLATGFKSLGRVVAVFRI